MTETEIEILLEEDCNIKYDSFWKGWSGLLTVLSLGIPIILFILVLYNGYLPEGSKINLGMNLANSIALLAAGASITGTLFSNHKNEKRNEKQMCEARNRLTKQINNQNINLKKQFDKQDENLKEQLNNADKRLETQLKSQQEDLKTQIISQKENLKTQLIHDKQQPILHDIHIHLKRNIKIFENPDEESNKEKIFGARKELYYELSRIKNDIKKLYYLPDDIISNIILSTQFIENKLKEKNLHFEDIGYTKNKPKFIEIFVDEGEEFQDYIKELIVLIEDETRIKIDR